MDTGTVSALFLSAAPDPFQHALAVARRGRAAERERRLSEARGHYDEARALLSRLDPTPLLANVLRWAGTVCRDLGEVDEAERCYQESLSVAETTGELRAQASALNCQAALAQRRGALGFADSLFRRAARAASRAGEIRLAGMIEQNLGVLANIRGDLAEAERRYAAALRDFEEVSDDQAAGWVLNNLALVQNDLGKHDEADRSLVRGLEKARRLRDRSLEGIMMTNRAEGFLATGRWTEARQTLDEALTILGEHDEPGPAAEAFKFLGILEREQGRLARSAALFARALDLARTAHDPLAVAEILRERGDLRLREGDREGALADWRKALESFRELGADHDVEVTQARLRSLPRASDDRGGSR